MCVFFSRRRRADASQARRRRSVLDALLLRSSATPCEPRLQKPAECTEQNTQTTINQFLPSKNRKREKKKAQKNKNRKKNAKKRPNTKEVQYQRHRRCNFLHGRQNKPRKPRRHRAAMTRRDVAPADDKGQGSTAEKHRTLTVIDVRSRPLKPARLRGR